MGLYLILKIDYIVTLAQQKFWLSTSQKLEIISNEYGSHESNPHNRNKKCTIRTLNLPKIKYSSSNFQVLISFFLKIYLLPSPTPKPHIVLNVENNKIKENREKSNTT
jgi:hypothetical protein